MSESGRLKTETMVEPGKSQSPRSSRRRSGEGRRRADLASAIQDYLRNEGRGWLRYPNIVGIGVGEKEKKGKPVGEHAVRFDVVCKFDNATDIIRAGSRPIPNSISIGGVLFPTDVIEAKPEAQALQPPQRKSKLDPLLGGISSGSGTDTGTLGAILWHKATGQPVGLSNWHVLANDPDGPSTYQPGPEDAGGQRHSLGSVIDRELSIDLDAAITTLGSRTLRNEIAALGVKVMEAVDPEDGMLLVKSGKETEVTYGRVSTIFKTTSYFVFGRPTLHDISVFEIQQDPLWPSPFGISRKGDSGSCWMLAHSDGRPTSKMVGLHVAGDNVLGLAYACPATKVFTRFGLEPVGNRTSTTSPAGAMVKAVHRVLARDGLLVRSGPGLDFPERGGLPFDAEVHVMSRHGDWVMVDLQGDGKADGFMHSAFLEVVGRDSILRR